MENTHENLVSTGQIPEAGEDYEYDENDEETTETSSGWCGCLEGLGFRAHQRDSEHLLQLRRRRGDQAGDDESWWVRTGKKAKEISEVLAGPKWKNFIRRLTKKKRTQFHYDPQSYALNFDNGIDNNS